MCVQHLKSLGLFESKRNIYVPFHLFFLFVHILPKLFLIYFVAVLMLY